jgi:hypothetical protein
MSFLVIPTLAINRNLTAATIRNGSKVKFSLNYARIGIDLLIDDICW